MLTETEKHAAKNILEEYHNIFARHRMDMFTAKAYRRRATSKKT